MNFIRSDSQAALNTLLVATRETIDQYLDAADLVEANLGQVFRGIGEQRRGYIHHLEDAVRASGDLPAVQDQDKEDVAILLHHVVAFIKGDYSGDILEQRIESEKTLVDLVGEAQATELNVPTTTLLSNFALHVSETIKQLQSLQKQVVGQKVEDEPSN